MYMFSEKDVHVLAKTSTSFGAPRPRHFRCRAPSRTKKGRPRIFQRWRP